MDWEPGARQTPLSMKVSREEYWSGLPFPSPGDLPDPGIEPRSPALQADFLPSEPPWKPGEKIGTGEKSICHISSYRPATRSCVDYFSSKVLICRFQIHSGNHYVIKFLIIHSHSAASTCILHGQWESQMEFYQP